MLYCTFTLNEGMDVVISQHNGVDIAEVISNELTIKDAQDALDVLANCSYQGADNIIWHEKNIAAAFFDLRTGLAGEVLQKFSNYRARLAIVGDFSKYESKALRDFIFESNRQGRISFVGSVIEAKEQLSK
ncbi:DUF4180 domain-containing protein [Imperialibacter roseus]|uniref:DUF4180 domain-containing protein n=1 Tax=Imperialibacter roseus TaxID=1324217 RepID=A0ABZ0IQW5_9BACT|nr:DUF4180 domain-containing protein [Imperialibacter roseus]WOK07111.1 DUF4180 domain-containing protein [Imperialibacter roseus]